MIYGATGYTGSLASERAKEVGIDIILGGRQSTKLQDMATKLQMLHRAFSLGDAIAIQANLKDVSVVLNCAGPFSQTAESLAEACIQSGVHYLDVSAELSTYLAIDNMNERAIRAGVMLLPGSGGSVALLGCLASKALARIDDASSIDVALHVSGPMSRGSLTSAKSAVIVDCLKCSEGELVEHDAGQTMAFDFNDGRGPVLCYPATLPDLFTIWKTTGVANVRTYVNVSGSSLEWEHSASLPHGPTKEERENNSYNVAIVAHGSGGAKVHGEMHTINGYTFTAMASVKAVRLVLEGKTRPGFQTPVTAFGAHFIDPIENTQTQFSKDC